MALRKNLSIAPPTYPVIFTGECCSDNATDLTLVNPRVPHFTAGFRQPLEVSKHGFWMVAKSETKSNNAERD